MPGVTYKCPSCGGYLAFDPESQRWKCPFCDSIFDESSLNEQDEASAQPAAQPGEGGQVVYHCPSCGSEIMTDETTVATQCYYCHSPVVLQGKLTDEWLPEYVLPFTISKEKAIKTFMDWVKSKRFVPKEFFKRAYVENIQGVYYPHYITNVEVDGVLEGEARDISISETPREIITTTRHFRVRREGRLSFANIMRPALKKTNRQLSDAIHPFPMEKAVQFCDSYLTGFLAERRDVSVDEIMPGIREEVAGYVEPVMSPSLRYDNHHVNASASITDSKSQYVLLPTWVLTYPNKEKPDEPYYYAMNGCTGETCGKLPIDKKRLRSAGLKVFAVAFVILCLVNYFIF